MEGRGAAEWVGGRWTEEKRGQEAISFSLSLTLSGYAQQITSNSITAN